MRPRPAALRTLDERAEVAAIYAAAEAAFVRDDLSTCRILLDVYRPERSIDWSRKYLLAARLARREGDFPTMFAAASKAASEETPPDIRLPALALRAVAARRERNDREAERLFERVRVELRTARPADGSYARYLVALDAWENRDYDRAERESKAEVVRDPQNAEMLSLLGWIAIKREQFPRAGSWFRKALAIVRVRDPVPAEYHGKFVHAVLNVAIETADLGTCERMRREYEKVEWSPSSRLNQFNTLSSLRYAALLAGDLEGAWFFARDAVAIAPPGAYAAIGEALLAETTRLIGGDKTASLELRKAWNYVRKERWGTAGAEERIALSYFAYEAASSMPNEARKSLMLYLSIAERERRDIALTNDRRVTAFELAAAGRVAEALGERREAVDYYRRSLVVWNELGLVTRSAMLSLDLLRLTRDPVYRRAIDELAKRAPQAWLVRQARDLDGPLGTLGPIQRDILARILRGDGAKAIAADLDRSPFTVINHTRKIFAAFEVNSRVELRRACGATGVTSELLGELRTARSVSSSLA